MTDHRSPEAKAYRVLYKSRAWIKGRLVFLAHHPLCERCEDHQRLTPATVVHHRKAHHGDEALFFDQSNWQAICAPCHDSDAQSEERIGFSKEVGEDGWPTDPAHPANR